MHGGQDWFGRDEFVKNSMVSMCERMMRFCCKKPCSRVGSPKLPLDSGIQTASYASKSVYNYYIYSQFVVERIATKISRCFFSFLFFCIFSWSSYDGSLNDWIVNQSQPQWRQQHTVPTLKYGDSRTVREIQPSDCTADTRFIPTETAPNKSHRLKRSNIPNVSRTLSVLLLSLSLNRKISGITKKNPQLFALQILFLENEWHKYCAWSLTKL